MTESAMLRECRVVVTRPAEQAEALAEELRALGARVRVRPLIGIAPPAEPAALRAALGSLPAYDWIAFTSANAVRACVAEAPAGVNWPLVAAVGSATARAAVDAGVPVTLVPAVFSGESLARAMTATGAVAGRRVLWPRASGARETLGVALRAAGAVVTEVECYRTVPDPVAAAALAGELRRDPADVLVFTSPSAVRALAAVAGASTGGAVAVIGGTTAAAAAAAGWVVGVRPADQSVSGLVAALSEWWPAQRG